MIQFIETTGFTDLIRKLGLETDLHVLQQELLENPTRGKLDPGTGGLRKIRMPDSSRGKGKSGGELDTYVAGAEEAGAQSDAGDQAGMALPFLTGREHEDMEDKLYKEFMASLGEALDHAKGKLELRTTTLPAPPHPMSAEEIRSLREAIHASQAVFAHCLNVSTKLVQAWEANRRQPQGAALRLLDLARREPQVVFGELIEGVGSRE